jgi:hypothetical protein
MGVLAVNGEEYINSIKDEVAGASPERIEELYIKVIEHKAAVSNYSFNTWQLFFAHIGQAWFLNWEMELRQMHELGKTEAQRQEIVKHLEWFEVMQKFFKVCKIILDKE